MRWTISLFEDYESFLEEHSPGCARDYRSFDLVSEMSETGFKDVSRSTTNWTRPLTHEQFIEPARSSSKMHAAMHQLGEAETTRRRRRWVAGCIVAVTCPAAYGEPTGGGPAEGAPGVGVSTVSNRPVTSGTRA